MLAVGDQGTQPVQVGEPVTVLAPGGNLLMKVLEGEEFPALLKETKALFKEAGATKPAASRDVSREIFIYGVGFEPPR